MRELRRQLLNWLLRAVALPALAGGAGALALAHWAGLNRAAAGRHGVLVALLAWLAQMPGLLLGTWRPEERAARRFVDGALLGLFALLEVFALAINAVTYTAWGGPPSSTLLKQFAPEPAWVLAQGGAWGAPALAALAALALALAALAVHQAHRGVERLGRPGRAAALCIGLVLAPMWAYASFNGLRRNAAQFPDDPLLALFRPSRTRNLEMTAERIRADAESARERALPAEGTPAVRRVVLVIIDDLREDRVESGYRRDVAPFFRELSARPNAHRFRRNYATATESLGGIAGIIASKAPRRLSMNGYGLVEFLARHGFKTYLLMSGLHDWYGLEQVYGPYKTVFKDVRDSRGYPMHDDHQILHWVEELPRADPATPTLVVCHFMGVHCLGYLDPADVRYSKGLKPFPWFSPGDPTDVARYNDVYDDRVASTDTHLRELWGLLTEKGYLDGALAVVTADHGEMLGEFGRVGHGPYVWDFLERVPLLVLSPRPRHWPAWPATSNLDIAPTIAGALGLRAPGEWEGVDLATRPRPRAIAMEQITDYDNGAIVLSGGPRLWKGHFSLERGREPRLTHVFDVAADPKERRDLLAQAPAEVVARLNAGARAKLSEP